MKNPARRFRDLILTASAKWANWDPPRAIEVGDYGSVDKETGRFEREGNILSDPDFVNIFRGPTTVTAIAEDQMIISSRTARKIDLGGGAEVDAVVASAAFKGRWEFGNSSGALLVVFRPHQMSLPENVNVEAMMTHPRLKGKSIVRDVWKCPAYALYLAEKGSTGISLALKAMTPIPGVPLLSAGPEVSGGWWSEHGSGFFRSGGHYNPNDEPRFTVLYTLKQCKMWYPVLGWREDIKRGEGLEGWQKLTDTDVPWSTLDDDGEEEDDNDGLLRDLSDDEDF